MFGLGAPELIVVLVIVLVLFGGAKLPQLAKSLGEAQREFKKGSEETPAEKAAAETKPDASDSPDQGPIS